MQAKVFTNNVLWNLAVELLTFEKSACQSAERVRERSVAGCDGKILQTFLQTQVGNNDTLSWVNEQVRDKVSVASRCSRSPSRCNCFSRPPSI